MGGTRGYWSLLFITENISNLLLLLCTTYIAVSCGIFEFTKVITSSEKLSFYTKEVKCIEMIILTWVFV